MDEQGLGGVAGRGVVALAVHRQLDRHRRVGGGVEDEVADPLGVAEDGDVGRLLDRAHQGARAARDDQVDEPVEGEQTGHRLPPLDPLHGVLRQPRGGERPTQAVDQRAVGVERLRAALEDDRVARAERQRADLDDGVGAALEDDQQHPERALDLGEDQPVVQLGPAHRLAHRVGSAGELLDPPAEGGELARGEGEPLEERRREVGGAGRLEVAAVGGEQLRLALAEQRGEAAERRRARGGRGAPQAALGAAGGARQRLEGGRRGGGSGGGGVGVGGGGGVSDGGGGGHLQPSSTRCRWWTSASWLRIPSGGWPAHHRRAAAAPQ